MARSFDPCLMILTLAIVSFWTANGKRAAAERPESVCHPYIGCFNASLTCDVTMLPESPNEIHTEFLLFTPENPLIPEIIDYENDSSITESNFQGNRGTKFIIPCYVDGYMRSRFMDMKDALLSVGNFNVIFVNWKQGSLNLNKLLKKMKQLLNSGNGTIPLVDRIDAAVDQILCKVPGYKQACQNTRLVGRQIGELSRRLQQLTGASFTSMHLIGHGLGAQMAGFAGEYLSGQYGRITGLDPAGPQFEKYRDFPERLLEKSDAIFVDIIHTSASLGNEFPVGHQDFYPNGGLWQDGCRDFLCNHLTAVDYFIESINQTYSLRTCPCYDYPCYDRNHSEDGHGRDCGGNGCPRMGYYTEPSPNTTMFMLGPYCKEDSDQPSLLSRSRELIARLGLKGGGI